MIFYIDDDDSALENIQSLDILDIAAIELVPLLDQSQTNLTDVANIIYSTMMPARVRDPQQLQHLHHAPRSLHDCLISLLDIDVALEIFRNCDVLGADFMPETGGQVPVATGHKNPVIGVQVLLALNPSVQLV